jgi:cell division protein FtsQ
LREQVITPRATGRSSSSSAQASKASAGGIVQRPARRGRGGAARARDAGALRTALAYLPLAGKTLLAIMTGLLIFAGYRAAASASFFQARSIEVNTTTRASADEIKAVVRRAVAGEGVWRADLDAISADLKRVPWVRSAVVTRVLPDGLRVRVTERVPVAVVRTAAGKLVWVDMDAVILGPMSPTDQMPPFFIRGLDEGAASAANRERMQKYEEMRRDWEAAGLSERISEVNLDDLRDVRAQLAGDDSQIEVRLGREDFGNRLKRALDELDNQRNTPRGPFIMYIDASQGVSRGSHLVVGLRPDAQIPAASDASNAGSNSSSGDAEIVKAKASEQRPSVRARKSDRAKETARKEDEQRRKKEREKKEKEARRARAETRPRRVG